MYLSIIRGERSGALATLARGGLRAASLGFRAAVAARSALHALGALPQRRAAVPVISIGNLTAGGTGKTPLAIALAARLAEKGEKVAVLARGYGAAAPGELNDELELVRRRVPAARVYAGKDRAASAERAVQEGATVLLLDDGFQHRRLHRDLDVLVVDATDPWGQGYLLPRGLLREPISAARRAHAFVISRVDQAPGSVSAIEQRIREVSGAPIATMRIEPFEAVSSRGDTVGLEALAASWVLLSAIGNPRSFEKTVEERGARIVRHFVHPDHHRYTETDLGVALAFARRNGARGVLTTEKDFVKLAPLAKPEIPDLWALRVAARLEQEDALLARVHEVTTHLAPGSAPRAVSRTAESTVPGGGAL